MSVWAWVVASGGIGIALGVVVGVLIGVHRVAKAFWRGM